MVIRRSTTHAYYPMQGNGGEIKRALAWLNYP